MSTDDALTDREAAVLDAATDEPDDETDPRDDLVALHRAATSHSSQEYQALRDTVKELTRKVNELEDAVHGRTRSYGRPDTIVERYAEMDPEERQDLVGSADRRAAVLLTHWWDMAKQAGNGSWVVTTHRNSTLKNNPAQVKIDLEKYCGEDLHWEEVYRAMRHLAKKSVDDPDTIETYRDDAHRLHIVGGAFHYHERATPDGQETYKLVELADADSLTVL